MVFLKEGVKYEILFLQLKTYFYQNKKKKDYKYEKTYFDVAHRHFPFILRY